VAVRVLPPSGYDSPARSTQFPLCRGEGIATEEERLRIERVHEEIARLAHQEMVLDERIRQAQYNIKRLSDDPNNQQLAFITYEDLVNLPCFRNDTLIAVKAPSGTRLEVPDPDEGMPPGQRRYQIFLKSSGEPIDVYLVQSRQQQQQLQMVEESQGQQQYPLGTSVVVTPPTVLPEPPSHSIHTNNTKGDEGQVPTLLSRPISDPPRPIAPPSPYTPAALRRPDTNWNIVPEVTTGTEGFLMKLAPPVDFFLTTSAIDESEGICDFFSEEETLATSTFLLDDNGAPDPMSKTT